MTRGLKLVCTAMKGVERGTLLGTGREGNTIYGDTNKIIFLYLPSTELNSAVSDAVRSFVLSLQTGLLATRTHRPRMDGQDN